MIGACPRCRGLLVETYVDGPLDLTRYCTTRCVSCGFYDMTFPTKRVRINMDRPKFVEMDDSA